MNGSQGRPIFESAVAPHTGHHGFDYGICAEYDCSPTLFGGLDAHGTKIGLAGHFNRLLETVGKSLGTVVGAGWRDNLAVVVPMRVTAE